MEQTSEVRISAVMTAPRYECVFARSMIERALRNCGIPLQVSGGVFYGQCMQRMFEQQLACGSDYVLTVDFDSIFTERDVHQLITTIHNRPEIDALAALQCRRGKDIPLLSRPVEEELLVDGPFSVDTAHFGLTVLRLDCLRSVPKPWFWCKPDANGEWTDDKTDDDIWFWKAWRAAGFSTYIHPFVSIGHCEEMITQLVVEDERLVQKFVYPKDWYQANCAEAVTA